VKERSPRRSIIHLDADAFFVGCEIAAEPSLRGKAVAVGGLQRGIIASASYEARKMGVYTPMPTSSALRICPTLLVLPGDYEKYEEFSRRMFSVLQEYTPEVEVGSIDEGYADFSNLRGKSPEDAARELGKNIWERLNLSVSIGLGSNKLVASVASKLHKPAGFTCVPAGNESSFLAPLGVRWLPGVGPKTEELLSAAGFRFISDVASSELSALIKVVGSSATQLRAFANGFDDRPVVTEAPAVQSYSRQETFEENTNAEWLVQRIMRALSDELMARVRSDRKMIRCVEVKIRHGNMEQYRRSESLEEPTDLETDTYEVLDRLLKKLWISRLPVRLVGVKFSQVYESSSARQSTLDLAGYNRPRRRVLASVMDKVKARYGPAALARPHRL